MIRPLALIVQAILLSRPAMPLPEAQRYARLVQHEALAHDFDPFTAVAIVHFESRWQPGAISPDGEDYGLGQIRARWLGACRADEDPVRAPSEACRAAKNTLLSPEVNLKRMSAIITANRELCKEKTGHGDLPRWLAGYEGLSVPSRDRWCAPSAKTWQVVEYRKKLVADLVPAAKKPAPATKKPAPVAKKAPPAAPRARDGR